MLLLGVVMRVARLFVFEDDMLVILLWLFAFIIELYRADRNLRSVPFGLRGF